jgi:hypothetical protein
MQKEYCIILLFRVTGFLEDFSQPMYCPVLLPFFSSRLSGSHIQDEWSNNVFPEKSGNTVLQEDKLIDQGRDGQNKC